MTSRRIFIRQIGLSSIVLGLNPNEVLAKDLNKLPRSAPEAQGVTTTAIHIYFDAIERSGQEFHTTMIVKNGFVIAEGYWYPYAPDHRIQLYSMSKSFTSTAIGLAQQEGLLNVEDHVIKYFQDVLPETQSENLKTLKIKHLLMMGVGMAKDSIMTIEKSPAGTPWAKTFLSLPIEFEPGTTFLYNSGASYMLSCIIQRITGRTVEEFLRPRLFTPLGMDKAVWTRNSEGINYGASHLRITTEDMAKFGQFYLQKGKWNGNQILNEDYIQAATTKQISNGNNNNSWGYGYGYQFWLNPPGGYRADGAFGQYSMVFPDQNAVVTIASESLGKADTMGIVWDVLWPELNRSEKPVANKTENKKLNRRLENLKYDPPKFETHSDLESKINNKEYNFEPNGLGIESLKFSFSKKSVVFRIKEGGIPGYQITCGRNYWIKKGNYKPKEHSLFSRRRIDFDSITAASAGWKSGDQLEISMRFIETCHGDYLSCRFDGDTLTIAPLFSVQRAEGKPDARKVLIGNKK
ncbi:MAG: serine hydrolase [Saprospiraceae bacterium]